ncbi:MAG: hypothetical protein MK089_07485 [Phycisphaerales bacterium]|nr:hypothetical protein [Phycisphaerales bacterium]
MSLSWLIIAAVLWPAAMFCSSAVHGLSTLDESSEPSGAAMIMKIAERLDGIDSALQKRLLLQELDRILEFEDKSERAAALRELYDALSEGEVQAAPEETANTHERDVQLLNFIYQQIVLLKDAPIYEIDYQSVLTSMQEDLVLADLSAESMILVDHLRQICVQAASTVSDMNFIRNQSESAREDLAVESGIKAGINVGRVLAGDISGLAFLAKDAYSGYSGLNNLSEDERRKIQVQQDRFEAAFDDLLLKCNLRRSLLERVSGIDQDAFITPSMWRSLGDAVLKQEDETPVAYRTVEQLLQKSPDFLEAQLVLGQLERRRGNVERARSLLTPLSKLTRPLYRRDGLAYRACIELCRNSSDENDHQAGVKHANEALQILPGDYRAVVYRGWHNYKLGNLAEAESDISSVVDVVPEFAYYKFLLAEIQLMKMESGQADLVQVRDSIQRAIIDGGRVRFYMEQRPDVHPLLVKYLSRTKIQEEMRPKIDVVYRPDWLLDELEVINRMSFDLTNVELSMKVFRNNAVEGEARKQVGRWGPGESIEFTDLVSVPEEAWFDVELVITADQLIRQYKMRTRREPTGEWAEQTWSCLAL